MQNMQKPYPKPLKILSERALKAAWSNSKDKNKRSAAPGLDWETPQEFKKNLSANISKIRDELAKGSYRFSNLRPFFVEKDNTKKDRVICVPSVRDRLVQRAICKYLTDGDHLRIKNKISFGFVKEGGVEKALKETIKLRTTHEYVLKTDIQSFFDQINRDSLISNLQKRLGQHSLIPLLTQVIKTEAKTSDDEDADRITQCGIEQGLGLRQGMPLSPLLANFFLRQFDVNIEKLGVPSIRYADDLILFFHDKRSADAGFKLVAELLKKLSLSIPELDEPQSKSEILGPREPVVFLGIEIAYLEKLRKYVRKMPKKTKTRILNEFEKFGDLDYCLKQKLTLFKFERRLHSMLHSYDSFYGSTVDWTEFNTRVRRKAEKARETVFETLFGENALKDLTIDQREFLSLRELTFEARGKLP